MKKFLFAVFIAVLLVSAGCGNTQNENGSQGGDKVIKLKVAAHFPTTNYLSTYGIAPWMDLVEKYTDNKVEFEYYPNEQLGKMEDMFDLARSKTADIVYLVNFSSKVPLDDLPKLPGVAGDSFAAAWSYWDMQKEGGIMFDSFDSKGLRPILTFVTPPVVVGFTTKKVESLEDFQKLKIRTAGGLNDITIDKLGAVPVTIQIQETVQALQKNTVDGIWLYSGAWEPYHIYDNVKYGIDNVPSNGANGTFVINKDVYASLPDDVKAAMEKATEEVTSILANGIISDHKDALNSFKEHGVEMVSLDEQELTKWEQKVDPIIEKWIADREKDGVPAQEAYDQFMQGIEKYRQ